MISVNLTCLVQAINFFIAYALIDRLFIRFVVTYLKTKKSQEQDLISLIARKKETLTQSQTLLDHEWEQFQNAMRDQTPDDPAFAGRLATQIKPTLTFRDIPQEQAHILAHDIAQSISKEIVHG